MAWRLLIARVRIAPRAVIPVLTPTASSGQGSVGQHRQRPAPAGEFAGDGDVGDDTALLTQVVGDPARVQPLVTGMTTRAGRRLGLVPASLQHDAGSVGGAVVPGRFDEQPAHVGVARFGDRPLGSLCPEECSLGTRPR